MLDSDLESSIIYEQKGMVELIMNTAAFIIGIIILSISIVGAAFLLVSGMTVGRGKKDSSTMSLQQPMLNFLTEYDAADYLGVSLNELDYMRVNGMLQGSFVSLTTLEQVGEEEYYDIVDGVEVVKTRPVMSNVTRYIYHREVLDNCMLQLMKDGSAIDSTDKNRGRNKKNKNGRRQNDFKQEQKPAETNEVKKEEKEEKAEKPAEKRPEIDQ